MYLYLPGSDDKKVLTVTLGVGGREIPRYNPEIPLDEQIILEARGLPDRSWLVHLEGGISVLNIIYAEPPDQLPATVRCALWRKAEPHAALPSPACIPVGCSGTRGLFLYPLDEFSLELAPESFQFGIGVQVHKRPAPIETRRPILQGRLIKTRDTTFFFYTSREQEDKPAHYRVIAVLSAGPALKNAIPLRSCDPKDGRWHYYALPV